MLEHGATIFGSVCLKYSVDQVTGEVCSVDQVHQV